MLRLEFKNAAESTEKEVTDVDIFVKSVPNFDQLRSIQLIPINVHIGQICAHRHHFSHKVELFEEISPHGHFLQLL